MVPSVSTAPSSDTMDSSDNDSSTSIGGCPTNKTVTGLMSGELDLDLDQYPSDLITPLGSVSVRNTFVHFSISDPDTPEVRRTRSEPSTPTCTSFSSTVDRFGMGPAWSSQSTTTLSSATESEDEQSEEPEYPPTPTHFMPCYQGMFPARLPEAGERAPGVLNPQAGERPPAVLSLASMLFRPDVGTPECPTIGSVGHFDGTCKPCAFFWKPPGCGNAVECPFCHLCVTGEKKRRQKEKKVLFKARRATEFGM